MVGVNITVTDGTGYNDTYIREGLVRVPDLSSIWHYLYDTGQYKYNSSDLDDVSAQSTTQILTHIYGESGYAALSPALDCGRYDNTEDILNNSNPAIDYRYYCRRTSDSQEFAYRFKEYNTNDPQSIYPYVTDRAVHAYSGPCYVYNNVSKPILQQEDGNPTVLWNWTFSNDSYTSTIAYPTQLDALCGTTYVYRGADVPQRDATQRCGDRCIWIWAHKTRCPTMPSDPDPAFYQCPISISNVTNTSLAEHNIADDIARLAASAIALDGRKQNRPVGWASYQLYPIG